MSAAIPSEHWEQREFVRWFRKTFPDVLIFAIPNGGHRGKAQAGNLKAEGVVPGVPDLYVPAWQWWPEMKRQKGGRVSPDQRRVMEYLQSIGHRVDVCNGCEAAKKAALEVAEQMQTIANKHPARRG